MDLRGLFLASTPTGKRDLYVRTTGSDANAGTFAAPFASINRALQVAIPGDRILVASGTYGYTAANGIGGRSDAWITMLPETPADAPKISILTTTDNFFEVKGSAFIGIYGFEVFGNQNNSNTNGSGLSIYGGSHHIRAWNNTIHDFPGGGINCFDVNGSHDMLDLSFNTIYKTSRYSPSNTSGISIYACKDYTGGETWPGGYAYRLVGNYIYDVVCTVPFTPGGFTEVTDGNGISLDLIYDTYGYTKPILVEGNIITGNGARAVHAYGTINVDMLHNTGVGNMRTNSPSINGDMEFDSESGPLAQTTAQAQSVRIIGNVIFPRNTPNWRDARSLYQNNVVLGGTQAVDGTGIDKKSSGWTYFGGGLAAGAELLQQPVGAWAPAVPNKVNRPTSFVGHQALGRDARPLSQWSIGAVEPVLPTRRLRRAGILV